MDMSPCAPGKECCLFDHGDHLGSGLGGVVTGVPWQMEWIEVVMMNSLVRCGKRLRSMV